MRAIDNSIDKYGNTRSQPQHSTFSVLCTRYVLYIPGVVSLFYLPDCSRLLGPRPNRPRPLDVLRAREIDETQTPVACDLSTPGRRLGGNDSYAKDAMAPARLYVAHRLRGLDDSRCLRGRGTRVTTACCHQQRVPTMTVKIQDRDGIDFRRRLSMSRPHQYHALQWNVWCMGKCTRSE